MAKKKIKPTPAGILFLAAIAVLIIALITVMIVLISNCNKNNSSKTKPVASPSATAVVSLIPSAEPTSAPTVDPSLNPISDETPDPNSTTNPDDTSGPVINTPPAAGTTAGASASATAASYYTEPTSSMKKNAQNGYVSGDKVNMRKGPGTKYDKVKSDISKGTSVTLYVEQKVGSENWWFLKCGDKYGYIKSDYIAKGSYSTSTGEVTGTVTATKIALRKDAKDSAECITEYYKGESVTIYYKDSTGKWYYVKVKSDGKKGWMYADYVKTSGKVGTKS